MIRAFRENQILSFPNTKQLFSSTVVFGINMKDADSLFGHKVIRSFGKRRYRGLLNGTPGMKRV